MTSFKQKAFEKIVTIFNPVHDSRHLDHDPFPFEYPDSFHTWRHFGVMIPDIGDKEFFDIMNIVGHPGVDIFDTKDLSHGKEIPIASVLSTTGSNSKSGFEHIYKRSYCHIDPIAQEAHFGDNLKVRRIGRTLDIERKLACQKIHVRAEISDTVSYFANIPGLYKHWSALAECQGEIYSEGKSTTFQTLGTIEFGRGVGTGSLRIPRMKNIPVKFFAYHILNISSEKQILITDVSLDGNINVQRRVFFRRLGEPDEVIFNDFVSSYNVTNFGPDDRSSSKVPKIITIQHDSYIEGRNLFIHGIADDNWKIGIGTGYAGTYQFSGFVKGEEVSGQAYLEYVDLT